MRCPMRVSESCDGQSHFASAMVRDHRDLGVKTAILRQIAAVANVAEDLVILGQFAFGREYVPLHPARRKA